MSTPLTPIKRGRPPPTGLTPQQRRKSRRRTPLRSSCESTYGRTLAYDEDRVERQQQQQQHAGRSQFVSLVAWSDAEMRALVEFLLFYSPNNQWPSTSKKLKIWSSAAKFVHERCRSQHQRSGGSIFVLFFLPKLL